MSVAVYTLSVWEQRSPEKRISLEICFFNEKITLNFMYQSL